MRRGRSAVKLNDLAIGGFSFGGSAVMTVMLCLGLLMSLERQQRTSSKLL